MLRNNELIVLDLGVKTTTTDQDDEERYQKTLKKLNVPSVPLPKPSNVRFFKWNNTINGEAHYRGLLANPIKTPNKQDKPEKKPTLLQKLFGCSSPQFPIMRRSKKLRITP